MGDNEISEIAKDLLEVVDQTKGIVTKGKVFKMVHRGHKDVMNQKEISTKKGKKLYQYLLAIAERDESKMTLEFISNLTRDHIRYMNKWMYRGNPPNNYNYEFSVFEPETIKEWISKLQKNNGGKLEKDKFVNTYLHAGGTLPFAERIWKKLAADAQVVTDVTKTIEKALQLYHEYPQDEDEEVNGEEEENVAITTPTDESRVSQPNKHGDDDDENYEDDEEDELIEKYKKVSGEGSDGNIELKEEL